MPKNITQLDNLGTKKAKDAQQGKANNRTPMMTTQEEELILPFAEATERDILGCLLLDNEAIEKAISAGLNQKLFVSPSHKTIFAAFQTLHEREWAINPSTLCDYLKSQHALDEIGGMAFVAKLIDGRASKAENLPMLIRQLRDIQFKRDAAKTAAKLEQLALNGATPREIEEALQSFPQTSSDLRSYKATSRGLIHRAPSRNGSGFDTTRLANFTARIITDVVEDDGGATKRTFEIEAELNGRKSRFIVGADEFAGMKWPMIHLGAKATVYPRCADHARTAIQELSSDVPERRVFTHTGWRSIEGEMVYLHGGGGIGGSSLKNVEVRLPESLQLVELPAPPSGEAWRRSMNKVKELRELAGDEIMIPAIGAAWASVIGGGDYSIWLYGRTESGKSQLAALIQSFFGRFNVDKLPGSWMSTANALESIAYAAKDMIFVVDDFKPTGGPQDRARLHRDADRLLRAQANQAGRQRLTSEIAQRQTKFPRGIIFNTAEEVPQGESLVKRLLVIECNRQSLAWSKLSALQEAAMNGEFATAMSGFVRWLAKCYSEKITQAQKQISTLRDEWLQRAIGSQKRCATTLGHLEYAWSLWLESAFDAGAIDEQEKVKFKGEIISALSLIGRKQDFHVDTQNPVVRFRELLQSAFASHKAHLVDSKTGENPKNPTAWGWQKINGYLQPQGDRIGWLAEKEILLLPDATFALLDRHAAAGEGLGVQQKTLWKQLHEAGVILKDEGRNTYQFRRMVEGKSTYVTVVNSEKFDEAEISENANRSLHDADIADIADNADKSP